MNRINVYYLLKTDFEKPKKFDFKKPRRAFFDNMFSAVIFMNALIREGESFIDIKESKIIYSPVDFKKPKNYEDNAYD